MFSCLLNYSIIQLPDSKLLLCSIYIVKIVWIMNDTSKWKSSADFWLILGIIEEITNTYQICITHIKNQLNIYTKWQRRDKHSKWLPNGSRKTRVKLAFKLCTTTQQKHNWNYANWRNNNNYEKIKKNCVVRAGNCNVIEAQKNNK